jgi:phage tail-like protein
MTHQFHLIDVSLAYPPVLLPVYGFSSITAPEITIQEREIKEANYEYPRKVFERATVNSITLSRGTQLQDTDFWSWIDSYLQGRKEKKNLILIQSTSIAPDLGSAGSFNGKSFGGGALAVPSMVESLIKTPGRAWVLRNCSPLRYKSASDFDAQQGAISIQELEISYEFFIDFNMGLVK